MKPVGFRHKPHTELIIVVGEESWQKQSSLLVGSGRARRNSRADDFSGHDLGGLTNEGLEVGDGHTNSITTTTK